LKRLSSDVVDAARLDLWQAYVWSVGDVHDLSVLNQPIPEQCPGAYTTILELQGSSNGTYVAVTLSSRLWLNRVPHARDY
jgi:hypothetical protein